MQFTLRQKWTAKGVKAIAEQNRKKSSLFSQGILNSKFPTKIKGYNTLISIRSNKTTVNENITYSFWFFQVPVVFIVTHLELRIHFLKLLNICIYYIDTDEITGLFLLLKNRIFIERSEDTIFIFHVWGYWCRHDY